MLPAELDCLHQANSLFKPKFFPVELKFFKEGGKMGGRATTLTRLCFLSILLIFTASLQAQSTWYVDDDAPDDPAPGNPLMSDPLEDGSAAHPFDSIQEGILTASSGDRVLVARGTYEGWGNRDLTFSGKEVMLQSTGGAQNCIIDCGGTSTDEHRGFYFYSGEGEGTVVQGFTIKNGYSYPGGAILCDNQSSPTIKNNILIGNISSAGG